MAQDKPTLIVMAAGLGSRYKGLKQIDPVGPGGETIMDYAIHDAVRAGFGKVVFVIRKAFEEPFKQQVGDKYARAVPVEYAFQELDAIPGRYAVPAERKKPWGTGQAVLTAESLVRGNFAVVNADDFYGPHAFELLHAFLTVENPENNSAQNPDPSQGGEKERYAMVGYVLRQTLSEFGTVARGVCDVDGAGRLKDITETVGIAKDGTGARFTDQAGEVRRFTGDETVSMNIWGFPRSVFAHLRTRFAEFLDRVLEEPASEKALKSEFYLPCAIGDLMDAGLADVRVLKTDSDWFGVTYREDVPFVQKRIRELIQQGVYPEDLWEV